MRRKIPGLPLLLSVLSISACAAGMRAGKAKTDEIDWVGSVEEALALSTRDGKPVLLYHTFIG